MWVFCELARCSFIVLTNTHLPLQPPGGSSNLWDLVSVIKGQDDSLLPPSYSKGVMHMKHLLKFKTVSLLRMTQTDLIWALIGVCTPPSSGRNEIYSFSVSVWSSGAHHRQDVQVWWRHRRSQQGGTSEGGSRHPPETGTDPEILRADGGAGTGLFWSTKTAEMVLVHEDLRNWFSPQRGFWFWFLCFSGRRPCPWLQESPWSTGRSSCRGDHQTYGGPGVS